MVHKVIILVDKLLLDERYRYIQMSKENEKAFLRNECSTLRELIC